jgi:hypothetical protein
MAWVDSSGNLLLFLSLPHQPSLQPFSLPCPMAVCLAAVLSVLRHDTSEWAKKKKKKESDAFF